MSRMPQSILQFLRSFGPAVIVASVVLGPGSILTASRVGTAHGYTMVWVLGVAAALMAGSILLAARVGLALPESVGLTLRQRVGRPFAIFTGLTLFVIIAAFQSSNNIAVITALEPLTGRPLSPGESLAGLAVINGLILAFLFGLRHLYTPLEKFMAILVGLMLIAFAANLIAARPSFPALASGFVPRLPDQKQSLLSVLGLFATTFSVAGAFYQAYLVKEKGWTLEDARRGLADTLLGVGVLAGLTLMILATSAAVLHGRVEAESLGSAADVARQLEPLFGSWAVALFSMGLFAGAFSSFLVNAMIGGTVLSDCLGLGAAMDQPWPRRLTAAALMTGALVAAGSLTTGTSRVGLIVLAQALTVLGVPVLQGSLLYLAHRVCPPGSIPRWIFILGIAGLVAVIALAVQTLFSIAEKF